MLTHKDFKLGNPVVTTKTISRWEFQQEGGKTKIRWKTFECRSPIKGIYIGWRTVSDGYKTWNGDHIEWVAETYFQIALIVTDPRQKPIPVPFSSLLPYLSPAP